MKIFGKIHEKSFTLQNVPRAALAIAVEQGKVRGWAVNTNAC